MHSNKNAVGLSVCMATYNGDRFIRTQIDSILSQIDMNDELIISDDGSTDSTLSIIRSYHDPRIKLLVNASRIGPVKNFEQTIRHATGQIILLSDQDDIWLHDKVAVTNACFSATSTLAIVSDARVVDSSGNVLMESFWTWRGSRQGFWSNFAKNGFLGCCMAFRSSAKQFLLPFPKYTNGHDEWIGLCCSVAGNVNFINRPLIDYRRHDSNVSSMSRGSILLMLKKRANYLIAILLRLPVLLRRRFSNSDV